MPRPGYARITAARELAMPESAPNQKGEFAPSPWSSGSSSRSPFIAATAASVSGSPTCTCRAHSGVRLMSPCICRSTRS